MAEYVVSPEGASRKAHWNDVTRKRVTGVTYHSKDKRWVVRIIRDGLSFTVGRCRYKRDAVMLWARSKDLGVDELAKIELNRVSQTLSGGHARYYPLREAMLGEPFAFRGRVFYPTGVVRVELSGGKVTEADRWETRCATCARLFTFYMGRPFGELTPFVPIVHCETHKAKRPEMHGALRVVREVSGEV